MCVAKVRDLLNGKEELKVMEDGGGNVKVVGLKEYIAEEVGDVLELVRTAEGVVAACCGMLFCLLLLLLLCFALYLSVSRSF
jgi:hypothetical protein